MADDEIREESRRSQRLMTLASRIDDNRPIDWDAEEQNAESDEERAVLSELRLLAKAAELFRDPEAPHPTHWGPLTIQEPIGHGAFGTVYRAVDNLSRAVALKLFSPLPSHASGTADAEGAAAVSNLSPAASSAAAFLQASTAAAFAASAESAARMLREGRLLARVKHPNVVAVHGVDEHDGRVGLWMEFIEGRTLEEELRARGTFGPEEAALIGRDLCRALAAVHAADLLHRDVKAHNVMREGGGRIVLMDFGAGREAGVRLASPAFDMAGTPLYLAPEVFAGLPAGRPADIYSLGVLLYHLVTDSYPVNGKTRREIRRRHRLLQRKRLRDARPDLPDGFVQVVERALASDPARRFQTAGELEEALTRACGLPSAVEAGRQTPPSLSREPGTRRSLVFAGCAFGAAALLAVVAASRLPAWTAGTPSRGLTAGSMSAPGVTPPERAADGGAGGPASAPVLPSAPASAAPAGASASYTVKANFYKSDGARDVDLQPGDRVRLGDMLGLRVRASSPVHVYVVTKDDRGEAFLLFPLPGQTLTNPLPAGADHRLPGRQTGGEDAWEVSSTGEREHFFVMASLSPMTEFAPLLAALPPARAGARVESPRIPADVIGQLRGVGRLGRRPPPAGAEPFRELFEVADPLRSEPEAVTGTWIRRLTLENPPR